MTGMEHANTLRAFQKRLQDRNKMKEEHAKEIVFVLRDFLEMITAGDPKRPVNLGAFDMDLKQLRKSLDEHYLEKADRPVGDIALQMVRYKRHPYAISYCIETGSTGD